jgi:hypothetical protein
VSSIATALKTPIPKGCSEDEKHILFISYLPDEEKLCVYPLTDEQIAEAQQEIEKEKETQEDE